jgi:GNAT superfamily N-acetyltransferase
VSGRERSRAPSIRTAILADASRIAALSEVLGYPVSSSVLEARLQRILSRHEDIVLVAEGASGGIIGWVHAADQETLESGRRCEILGLVVDAAHRGQGVGRQLVDAVEAWAAQRGIGDVTVRSNVVRAESHRFYGSLGYRGVKTQHVYRKRLPDTGRQKEVRIERLRGRGPA